MKIFLLWLALTASDVFGQVRFAPAGQPSGGRRALHRAPSLQLSREKPDGRDFLPFRALPQQQQGFSPPRSQSPPPPPPSSQSTQTHQATFRPAIFRGTPPSDNPTVFHSQTLRASPTPQHHQQHRTTPSSVTAPSPVSLDRSQSRFQQPQLFSHPQEFDEEVVEYEDYSDEPDRLSILLSDSKFQCNPSQTGYYADDSVNCEVFHYCSQGVKHSWVCPDGNIFHQINLICQPPSSDNICQRSNDFHFVNDYLYQLVKNDSSRPEYADRFYPENYYPGSEIDTSSSQSLPIASRPTAISHHRRQQTGPASPSVRTQDDSFRETAGDFQQTPQSLRGVQRLLQSEVATTPSGASFSASRVASLDATATNERRENEISGGETPLPPVRPAIYPFPSHHPLNPDIRSHGTPIRVRRLNERRDRTNIVLGGFQGNVDIHDLASRNSGPRF